MRAERQVGFTLIEMLMVVAIVVVLGFVAMSAYRRYLASARKSEVMSLFAEIRAREEAYRSEFSAYASSGTGEDDLWPKLAGASEPKAKDWMPTPGNWSALGVNPGKGQVYCGYSVVAGDAASFAAAAGTRGKAAFATAPTGPWWYATGICDNDGSSAKNATYLTTSESQTLYEQFIQN